MNSKQNSWMLLMISVIALIEFHTKTKIECYKAAQVNQNIKCEESK
jgi:hypothetical protein